MPISDAEVQRALVRLNHRQRIETWLDLIRKSGGLAFPQAPGSLEGVIFQLEQTTPESARAVFVRDRNAILAANAVLSWVLGADRLRTEALLARVTSLLSLQMLVKAPDARGLLESAVRERESAREAGTRPKRRRIRSLNSLSPADMADSISLLYGVMFEYDESGLESYWAEALRSAAVQDPGVSSADLSALLETRGEPIERSFGHYAHHLTCCIRRPIDLAHRLFYELVPGLTEAHLTLAPVDAQLARNKAIADVLKPYLGSARYHLSDYDVAPLQDMVESPLKHARTRSVIKRYEDWLYPGGQSRFSHHGLDMVWEPWQDFYSDETRWDDLGD